MSGSDAPISPKIAARPSTRASVIPPSIIRRLFDARRPTSINLGLGEPGMPIPLELLDAGVARFRKVRMGYSPNSGIADLRQRIAEYYRLPHAQTGNVIITVGLQEALASTLMAIADPGDEILISDPAFLAYRALGELLGLKVTAVPSRPDFSLDIDALVRNVGPHTRAIILNSPSNPTGRIDDEATIKALIKETERFGLWLVSDEVYREIYFTESTPPSVGTFSERGIVLGALSKSCSMTGFRLGYVLAPDDIVSPIASVHQFNVTSAPTISQFIALEVFEHPEWLSALRPVFAKQRAAIMEAVDHLLGLPYAKPEGGFFLFLDIRSTGLTSMELAQQLLADGDVVTVPGSAFGPHGEGYLRLSFGGKESEIVEGIARISKVIKRA